MSTLKPALLALRVSHCRLSCVYRPFQHRRFHANSKPKCSDILHTVPTNSAIANEYVVSKSDKKVAYWLLGMCSLVAGMVTVGGITRLTRSGLSMTDWKLQGSLPPLTPEQWGIEFERYKQYPEWQQRKSMTLDEFKFIYYWEYGHRMMGRSLGVAFTLPMLYFSYRNMIPSAFYPKLGGLFVLGGTQGLIGWWMVKSGLNVDPKQKKEIRVSPYRLATHLSMAFTTYTLLLWTALDLLNPIQSVKTIAAKLPATTLNYGLKIRNMAVFNGVLVASTVLSGAYVAGNDAGNAFNTFPMMNDEWIPSEILDMKPLWRNFFENTATVQFDHRVLALTTLSSIWSMYYMARTGLNKAFYASLPSFTRKSLNAVAHMSIVQVGLGIGTLLLYVPVPLAAVHQAGSLALLTFITCLVHSLKYTRLTGVGTNILTNLVPKFVANPQKVAPLSANVVQFFQRK